MDVDAPGRDLEHGGDLGVPDPMDVGNFSVEDDEEGTGAADDSDVPMLPQPGGRKSLFSVAAVKSPPASPRSATSDSTVMTFSFTEPPATTSGKGEKGKKGSRVWSAWAIRTAGTRACTYQRQTSFCIRGTSPCLATVTT